MRWKADDFLLSCVGVIGEAYLFRFISEPAQGTSSTPTPDESRATKGEISAAWGSLGAVINLHTARKPHCLAHCYISSRVGDKYGTASFRLQWEGIGQHA